MGWCYVIPMVSRPCRWAGVMSSPWSLGLIGGLVLGMIRLVLPMVRLVLPMGRLVLSMGRLVLSMGRLVLSMGRLV